VDHDFDFRIFVCFRCCACIPLCPTYHPQNPPTTLGRLLGALLGALLLDPVGDEVVVGLLLILLEGLLVRLVGIGKFKGLDVGVESVFFIEYWVLLASTFECDGC
jgi:hypothetical protein